MISRAQEGFEYAAITARKAAQSGDIQSMGRQLASAHALALWACPALLDRHKDTMVLVVAVVGTLPLLVLDFLAMRA